MIVVLVLASSALLLAVAAVVYTILGEYDTWKWTRRWLP